MSTISLKNVKLGDSPDPSKNFVISVPAVADGTLTIKREDGTNVLSVAADGKAVIPGVVGTVAQVGGVPTGQVVERGSNATGDYTRFADGTQICWVGSGFAGVAQETWTFPAIFVSRPQVSALVDHSLNPALYLVASVVGSPSATTFYRYRHGDFTTTPDAFYIRAVAVGRWF